MLQHCSLSPWVFALAACFISDALTFSLPPLPGEYSFFPWNSSQTPLDTFGGSCLDACLALCHYPRTPPYTITRLSSLPDDKFLGIQQAVNIWMSIQLNKTGSCSSEAPNMVCHAEHCVTPHPTPPMLSRSVVSAGLLSWCFPDNFCVLITVFK